MLISASRRTDILAFYFEWFLNRLKEGYALVRNPMNHAQVSRVSLSPELVDCIAFWTKNPAPMLPRLAGLAPYPFYVQFSLNPYGPKLERNLPPKPELVETFRRLAAAIGPERVVWRYSPVVLNQRYSAACHLDYFGRLAESLSGYTTLCRLSFMDMYAKIERRMTALGAMQASEEEKARLAREFAHIASTHGITLGACGNLELAAAGIKAVGCIDRELIERITGYELKGRKDPGQRGDCYCLESVDIGSYQTCLNGCTYCYANHSETTAQAGHRRSNPLSAMLCDAPREGDNIAERKVKSLKETQLRLV